jgi:hypothetical protein
MPADSLMNMARRKAMPIANFIPHVGDMPWEVVAPIIQKVADPKHLVSRLEALSTTANTSAAPPRANVPTNHRPR